MPRKKSKTKETRPKFPYEIFVTLEPCEAASPDSEKYLSAFGNLGDAFDGTSQDFIGTYRLVSTSRIVRGTTLVDVQEMK